jgi:DNA-directed RNA polymerase specialized sigma24 family protein
MNKQEVLDTLDSIAASLSALASEVNKVYIRLQLPDASAPVAQEPEKPKKRERTYTAARWLPNEKKECIRLAIDEKKTAEEIGALLNRTPAAIMSFLRRELRPEVYNAWLKTTGRRAAA